jgi:translation initiation factor IF-1
MSTGAPTKDPYTLMLLGSEGSCTNFMITSAGGHCDPHFYGFHGEKMEVKRDDFAANQLFHVYCSPSITVTTLFYEYPDKLLFMTKFWVKLGETTFTLNLSTKPKMLSSGYEGPFFMQELGRFRIDIPDGHLEWDDNKLRVVYKYLQMNFSNKLYTNNAPYMNIDINTRNSDYENQVTGIVGRTLHQQLTNEEFENYHPFKATVSDIVSFSCSSLLEKLEQSI